MRPSIIDLNEAEALMREMKELAEETPPISLSVLQAKGYKANNDVHTRHLGDLRMVLTHEEQKHGICRHFSISVDERPGARPNLAFTKLLLQMAGFVNPMEECVVWEEDCGHGYTAINVLEPLDGDWTPFQKKENSDA